MKIIEDIIKNKKNHVNQLKKKKPLKDLKKETLDIISTKNDFFPFEEKLKNSKSTCLITEYKPASPSQGNISNLTVNEVIKIYDENPVDMISVLTEESYFKSNLNNFNKARNITSKPLLRKDFVIDEYMIYESAKNNANCILLIANICPDIEQYLNITEELGINAIVECHDKNDIENIEDYDPRIIGINNRNLKNFTIDLETTKKLKDYVPNYMISESGVQTVEDAKKLKGYGADGILIGTSILKDNSLKEIKIRINELNNVLKN